MSRVGVAIYMAIGIHWSVTLFTCHSDLHGMGLHDHSSARTHSHHNSNHMSFCSKQIWLQHLILKCDALQEHHSNYYNLYTYSYSYACLYRHITHSHIAVSQLSIYSYLDSYRYE